METKFAPALRADDEKLNEEFRLLDSIEYIEKLINSLPYLGAILNARRQIVFANNKLLETLDLQTIDRILGVRPGEALGCIHACDEAGGCGTSESCSVCGAVNCILEAQRKNKKTTSECRVTTKKENILIAYDFLVTTIPFQWKDEMFYIFSLVDISSEKRRRAMEQIFFHDVLNKTGSIYGFIDLIKREEDISRIQEHINSLDLINNDLINEIQSQRDLNEAEHGELRIKKEQIDSIDIIVTVINQIRRHEVAQTKNLMQDVNAEKCILLTDGVILRRILMNMLKNALEATNENGNVSIGCNSAGNACRFWVSNNSYIPHNSQMQIFQRSYSTKGVNRGLGTYSMKLLGEQYLKGKVGFTTDEIAGTTFYIEIPGETE